MPTPQDVLWFKAEFGPRIQAQVAGTPFSVDMIAAFACQETGEIWPALRRQGLATPRILELCVGDTLDANPAGGGRRAFPKNKAELIAAPEGARMFAIARQGLVDMASCIPAYRAAAAQPDKFCHGFGIFQLDLQFFRTEPVYFLDKRYADFDAALGRCIGELKAALKRLGWQAKTALGDAEMAAVAIAYNTGRYDPAKGLKQGYFDGRMYYGESYDRWLKLAHSAAPAPAGRGFRSARGRPVPDATSATKAVTKRVEAKKAVKKKPAKKAAATREAAKRKIATKQGARAVVSKNQPAAKKAATKKAATKKAAAKEIATKKPATKKSVAKRASPKRSTPRR